MTWVRVSVDVSPEDIDLLTVVLGEVGASGVEVRDDETFPDGERPLGPGLHRALAYFGGEPPEALAARVLEAATGWGIAVVGLDAAPFTDESWKTSWKQYFKPTQVSPRLMVAPPWDIPAVDPGVVQVIIEPGLAFGTGTHATTQLSMRLLDGVCAALEPRRVLDVGCGSGILAIACARLQGEGVAIDAIDIDPEAQRVARENFERNGVASRARVLDAVLADLPGPYEVVVANIISNVLCFLAADLVRVLAPGGRLVLGGIGPSGREEVRAAFGALGLTVLDEQEQEGWFGMVLECAEKDKN